MVLSSLATALAIGLTGCSDPEPPPPPPPPAEVIPEPEPPKVVLEGKLAKAVAKVPGEWKSKSPPEGSDEALAAGEALYAEDCAGCHGVKGDGDGPAARALPQRPTDFTDAARWAATTPGEKAWLIKSGIPGTSMAPRDLDEDAIWGVLFFVENSFQ